MKSEWFLYEPILVFQHDFWFWTVTRKLKNKIWLQWAKDNEKADEIERTKSEALFTRLQSVIVSVVYQ